MLGKCLLFLGYSFNDINLRLMLYKLMKLRRQHKRPDRIPMAVMAGSGFTPIQGELLERWEVLVIELDPVDRNQAVDEFLGKLG
jgi:SIR2-like domain